MYAARCIHPSILVRVNFLTKRVTIVKSRITKRVTAVVVIDLSSSFTADPVIPSWMAHGSPKPSKISKIFDPKTLDIDIAPFPCRATIMDTKRSGREVPAAQNVSPVNPGEIFSKQANFSDHFT